jgi:hypothetical protein
MDFFTFFVLVCFVAILIYARTIEDRRRKDNEKLSEHIAALISRVHALEQQAKVPGLATPPVAAEKPATATHASAAPTISAPTPLAPKPATPPASPAVQIFPRVPVTAPTPSPKPAAPAIPATTSAKDTTQAPIAAAAAASAAPPAKEPVTAQPMAASQSIAPKAETAAPEVASASHAATLPLRAMTRPSQPQLRAASEGPVPFSTGPYAEATATKAAPNKEKKVSLSLEEAVGTNWLPKIGITAVVIGIALLTASQWGSFAPALRVVILYIAALGTLGTGIFLERKERYRNVGRALIGGGWAITFVVSYAISHVRPVLVLPSATTDLFLLLAVAGVMVWHTLKYNSQTVTGIAFLLGFVSVTLNPDPPYNLIAGAMLVAGMTVLVLRRHWFELEVFGILASYLNHFYWLYPIISRMEQKGPFPNYTGSVVLLISYWTVFRASYLVRKVSGKNQEAVSTVAGLLNPLLFLAVMKYQSYHSRIWAFYALLAIGAVEFTLGQLPVARRRRVPFQILSSLGATLMLIAVPFKYSGSHSLELLWMAGAEAFLLAGIFARERLFRQFAGIISLLVAAYLCSPFCDGIISQISRIVTGQPHYDAALSIALTVIAALFYLNSHVICRKWSELFEQEIEQQAISALSFIASIFAVGAVYAAVRFNAVAVILAVLVVALAAVGKFLDIKELRCQAHWIAALSVIDVSIVGVHLDAAWNSIPERLITFGLVSALLYVGSRLVRVEGLISPPGQPAWLPEVSVILYRWAATGLIALLIWLQIWFGEVRRDWLIAVLWTALALVLSGVAQLFKRSEFKWQAFVLAMMSFCSALTLNFNFAQQFHHLSYRLISVSLVAVGTYLLARWAPLPQIRQAYSWAGTILLGYLAFAETQQQQPLWTPVLWVGLALVLVLAARLWKDRALLWQMHLLALTATGWTIAISFLGDPNFHGTRAQLFTVLITSAVLYSLTWLANIPGIIGSATIWQAYSWAGSLLLSWLAWYQLDPINVSLAWGVFGLALFEIGYSNTSAYLRAQAYIALILSFAHLFYSNFNTPLPGGIFDPRMFLIVLPVPIYFWVYWRLHTKTETPAKPASKLKIEYLLACLGTATVAALIRFEIPLERVVIGYAAIVLALLVAAWLARLQIFLYQALVMLGVTVFRLSMHNLRDLNSSIVSNLSSSIWAIGLLAVGIPFAFLVRSKKEQESTAESWFTFLARRPEQPMFFAAVILMAALLAIKLPDMITLAWGIEGIVVFLLALFAKERSFRLTGLALLILCVAKIAAWDAWRMNDPRARYLTLIGVGAILLIVSYLYARNREALREYL